MNDFLSLVFVAPVAAISATGPVDLKVPYWPQTDNYTQSERTCNSSSCAMVLEFFKPEAVVNDDQYIKKLIIPTENFNL